MFYCDLVGVDIKGGKASWCCVQSVCHRALARAVWSAKDVEPGLGHYGWPL